MESNRYDIVIIGTGLGGLECGYILAKNGFKVLLLEKNSRIGGCLQTFDRFGVKFDTGMHYVGSMLDGQIMNRLFRYFNLYESVPLQQLDEDGYDRFCIAGKQYRYASGYEHFTAVLSQQFPNHRDEIRNYVRQLQAVAADSPLYDLRKAGFASVMDSPYARCGASEFIDSFTENTELRNVLAGNLPLYAGVRDKTPAYIHVLIQHFYIQSAWRVIGGSDAIAQSLADSIRAFGGEIRTESEVAEIECDATHATGVRLASGERVEANAVISDVHPFVTLELTRTPLLRKAYRDRIGQLENTVSNFTLYLKFKERTVPYLNYNYYYYRQPDVWRANDGENDFPLQQYLFMHQCVKENQRWAQSAVMMGPMRYEEVSRWAGSRVGRRGDDYRAFKERVAERYLDALEQSFPGIRSCVEHYETASPLTYRDYTGTRFGSMYGVLRDKNFPAQTFVSQRTKVPNLLLTGQNINAHGILGVTVGALLTCAEFLGLQKVMDEMDV